MLRARPYRDVLTGTHTLIHENIFMKNYRMYASSINERYVDELVELLKKGGVVIYPTDSFYALGCDALNNRRWSVCAVLKALTLPDSGCRWCVPTYPRRASLQKSTTRHSLLKATCRGRLRLYCPLRRACKGFQREA